VRELVFSMKDTEENRLQAISKFLKEARQSLVPYNVFLSTDIFGCLCWNLDDIGIGERLQELAPELDYVSPMLYPPSFNMEFPGMPILWGIHTRSYISLWKRPEKEPSLRCPFPPWLQLLLIEVLL